MLDSRHAEVGAGRPAERETVVTCTKVGTVVRVRSDWVTVIRVLTNCADELDSHKKEKRVKDDSRFRSKHLAGLWHL